MKFLKTDHYSFNQRAVAHWVRSSLIARPTVMIYFGSNLPRLRLDLGLQERILKFLKVSQPSPTESEGVAVENFLLESLRLGMGTK